MLMTPSGKRAVEKGAPSLVGPRGLALTALLMVACTGAIGDRMDKNGPQGSPTGSGSGTGITGGPGATGTTGPGGVTTGMTTGMTTGGPAMCTQPMPAPNFHRLNAKQYEQTVNQLLSTQLQLRADLPVDSNLYGFDNNADTSISASVMEKYLNVARSAVTAALAAPASRMKLVPCSLTTNAATCIKTVLTSWLPKAFRRPVLPAEIDKYAAYSTVCSSSGDAGLSCALQAALLSPNFLFRTELLPIPEAATCSEDATLTSNAQNILGQYALASRLSYFLWNSPPDDTLYSLAAAGTLVQPMTLAQQVDRMLAPAAITAHPVGFVQDFPAQFLPVSALATVQPSPTVYPTWDEPLRQAMKDESLLFFQEVLQGGHSALDLVKADYTFVNDRLAKHYGIPGITGSQMRMVPTTGTTRGGFLSQGTFLTATSSTENTSLVLRAKWVLKNMLCFDLPAPRTSRSSTRCRFPIRVSASPTASRSRFEPRTRCARAAT